MMTESIRERFLRDHRQLRGKASVLRSLALGVMRGDDDLVSALRLKGEELQTHLLLHMSWEEDELLPSLVDGSESARDLAAEVHDEHREQRVRLAHSLVALRVTTPEKRGDVERLAKEMLDLVRWLETDMLKEEEAILPRMRGTGSES